MSTLSRLRLLLLALFAAAVAVLPLAQAAQAKSAPDVPTAIAVPEGNTLFLVGHAVGVQIYGCTTTASGQTWTLVAPRAELYGDNGRLVATHFAGPTWQATDGSRVVGQKDAGIVVDPTAVAWLRLKAVSTTAGSEGDRLVGTTYVQRLATTGGLPPSTGCDATSVGAVVEVPYTADYYFWR